MKARTAKAALLLAARVFAAGPCPRECATCEGARCAGAALNELRYCWYEGEQSSGDTGGDAVPSSQQLAPCRCS